MSAWSDYFPVGSFCCYFIFNSPLYLFISPESYLVVDRLVKPCSIGLIFVDFR